MNREERIESVAMVIFRQRGGRLLPGDRLSRHTVSPEDLEEAERFVERVDAVFRRFHPDAVLRRFHPADRRGVVVAVLGSEGDPR